MKRTGKLYGKICSMDNLRMADEKARKGKDQPGIREHDRNRDENMVLLQELLRNGEFKTSGYTIFKIYEPKEREIYRLPYYPDRIVHHAIMNVLEPIFVAAYTADTYSCIKGRGIHAASEAVKTGLKDVAGTMYCLKLDVRKFYPSIDHDVLLELLNRKFKDVELLRLLEEIIRSAPGLPIGNYLSQYMANFYLSGFDHWIKEVKRVKYYYRYADDMVILAGSKPELHSLLAEIKQYLGSRLHLDVKGNYQVFPVAKRGIDFVGYRFYHTHTMLRKSIKKNFARMLRRQPNAASIASYNGWLSHCNAKNLNKKLKKGNEKLQGLRDNGGVEGICGRENKH